MPDQLLSHGGLIIVQLLVATVCGGLIGYQRETVERPAGFRTHILVCVGSAIYMLVSTAVAGDRFDPGRIAAQVASGIGFLGAGTIIKQGSIVRGLTTAASLWAVAGVGLAAGYGGRAMIVAFVGTLIIFLSLTILSRVEYRLELGHHGFSLEITLAYPRNHIAEIRSSLSELKIQVERLGITGETEALGTIVIDGRTPTHDTLEEAMGQLLQIEGVRNVERQFR